MSSIKETPETGGKFTRYKINDGVRIICDDAFRGCEELIDVFIPASVNFIGDNAFSGCGKLKTINLPESVIYIGNGAFDCYEGHVTLPATLEIIDGNPFCQRCKLSSNSLKYIVVNNVLFSSDMKRLISYCGTDSEYTIPQGVEVVGKQAFRSSGLNRLYLNDMVTTIESGAFEDNEFQHLLLPPSTKRVSESAFSNCNIGCLEFSSKVEFFENHDKYLSFAPDYNIIKVPSGLLDYYKDLFSNNEVIDIIDEDIIYEDGWFLNQDKTELISSYGFDDDSDIAIPEGIVLVRNKSLYQIAMLSDVKIHFPKSINSITGDALLNNSDLELYVPKGARGWYLSIFPELEDNIIEE